MALSPEELQIAEYGKAQGKTKEQVMNAIAKYRSTQPTQAPTLQPTEPSLTERLGNIGMQAGEQIQQQIAGTGQYADQNAVQRGIGATATAFNVLPQAVTELAPQPVRSVLGKVSEAYTKAFDWLSNKLSPQIVQDFVAKNPEITKKIEASAGSLADLGNIANSILLAEGVKTNVGKVANIGKTGVQSINQVVGSGGTGGAGGGAIDTTSSMIGTGVEKAKALTKDLTAKVVKNVSEKNVNPQLQVSVENLVKPTTAPQVSGSAVAVKDPLKLYNEFAKQEELFKTNIKADTALNVVGERTGNAFEKVIKQRQSVGNVMGEELKKVGGIKTNTQGAFENFRTELRDSGVAYDVLDKKLTQIAKQTKFTASDKAQLQYYAREFQKLGTNPTVVELDAFMSRIPKAIDVYKASKNIIGTTNAERIIKNSLSDLRKSLLSSGNPALDKYAIARSLYSQLSDFVNEGAKYLGKKTASGDFSRDASIAKSSVQSILNGGKKDWLIQLEQLTGYKALDEAVLALQAMKDAGNFRGASLLDLLTPSELPTSTASLVNKGVDYLMQKGASALTGSPADQTRRIIQSAIQAQKESASNAIPKGGQSTKSISNTNSSIEQTLHRASPEVQRVIKITK